MCQRLRISAGIKPLKTRVYGVQVRAMSLGKASVLSQTLLVRAARYTERSRGEQAGDSKRSAEGKTLEDIPKPQGRYQGETWKG
jgi:hypothetical protein